MQKKNEFKIKLFCKALDRRLAVDFDCNPLRPLLSRLPGEVYREPLEYAQEKERNPLFRIMN